MTEPRSYFIPFSELLERDATNSVFVVLDPGAPTGSRPVTLADRYRDVEALSLPETVPDSVKAYFDATRMLWVYGYLYYPFYTWAALHAQLSIELALKARASSEAESVPTARKQPTFDELLQAAVKRGWITMDGITRLRREVTPEDEALRDFLREAQGVELFEPLPTPEEKQERLKQYLRTGRRLRNRAAHPEQFSVTLPNYGYASLEVARDIIRQLFP